MVLSLLFSLKWLMFLGILVSVGDVVSVSVRGVRWVMIFMDMFWFWVVLKF